MFGTNDLRTALRYSARIVPRCHAFSWEASRTFYLALLAILMVNAVIPALITWLSMKVLLDGVVDAAAGSTSWFTTLFPLGAVVVLSVLNAGLTSAYEVFRRILQEKTADLESVKILEKSGSLDIAFFETPKFYDLLQQATEHRWYVHFNATQSFSFLQQLISFVAMVSLLAVLHPIAICVLIATALPSLLMQGRFARERREYFDDVVRGSRVSEYIHDILTSRHAANEIRIFSLVRHFISKYRAIRVEQLDNFWDRERTILKADIFVNALSLVGLAAIWVYAVIVAASAQITIGDLALVISASTQCRGQLEAIVRSTGQVFENVQLASRFFEFLDLDPESVPGTLARQGEQPMRTPQRIQNGIELHGVSFSYPGSDRLVLEGLSLSIPRGCKLAIVGENGAGKTTIVKLLTRLYDPTSGQVELDGHDLRNYRLADVRDLFGVIFQDFVRYELTVGENIGFGSIAELNDRQRIEEVAKRIGVDQLIQNLPKRYDTMLGKTFDEGVDLSGGEWQQLAIARAINSDSEILVLDEPTASLDALREQQFYESFAEIAANRTVVFISHRFSTVKMADVIVVLEQGKIIESGSHAELMSNSGKYAHMYRTQAGRYTD